MPCLMAARYALYVLYVTVILTSPATSLLWGKSTSNNLAEGGGKYYGGREAQDNDKGAAKVAGIRIRAGAFDGSDRRSQGEYSGQTWIQNFCRTPGNEFFAEVVWYCLVACNL